MGDRDPVVFTAGRIAADLGEQGGRGTEGDVATEVDAAGAVARCERALDDDVIALDRTRTADPLRDHQGTVVAPAGPRETVDGGTRSVDVSWFGRRYGVRPVMASVVSRHTHRHCPQEQRRER